MTERKRNGWTNYETWAVNLWLTNNEPYWTEAAREAARAEQTTVRARLLLAERLQAESEESAPDLGASVWAGLLNAAIGRVDWHEIADALLEAVADEDRTAKTET